MAADFKTALARRRSNYDLSDKSSLTDAQIKELVDYAVLNTPSAFNSQSARVVILLGGEHKKLWEIVRETLRKIVPPDKFQPTDDKINGFAAGYGTLVVCEDQGVIRSLQQEFPLYKDAFPGFSANSTGMLQLALWVMLKDAGMGASLQHYGNLIEKEVQKTWNLGPDYQLIAQMPFGVANSEPEKPEREPIEKQVKLFKS